MIGTFGTHVTGVIKPFLRKGLPFALALLGLVLAPAAVVAQRTPTSSDLKPPIEDLSEIEGEIVWLQGAILRGSPAPYRNPSGPLAAYEQGLLDDEGQLWTMLDNPEGRELRYNPDLRGKKVKIRGWFHAKSYILEVYQWFVGNHPVRADAGFEPPEKKPFNPSMAELIETIPPIPLEPIPGMVLKDDLWLLEEGLDLGIRQSGPPAPTAPTEEAERLKRLIEDIDAGPEPLSDPSAIPEEPPLSMPAPRPEPQGFTPDVPVAPPPPRPTPVPAPPLLNDQGQPLTTPDEFDEALQRELIQQIKPE